MSIQPIFNFTDSADHYVDGQLASKWTTTFNAHIVANGRFGQGIGLTPGFISPGSVGISLFPQGFWQVGYAYNLGVSSGFSPGGITFNATQDGQSVITLQIFADNQIVMFTSGGAQHVIGLGPILRQNTWHYIEMIIGTIIPDPIAHPNDPIACYGGLRVDGKLYFDVTVVASSLLAGVFAGGNLQIDKLTPSSANQSLALIDDFYAFFVSGSSVMAQTFGDCKVIPSYPNTDIANTDPTLPGKFHPLPSPPTIHYNLVNEHPPDFGSTFIEFVGIIGGTFTQRVALDTYIYDTVTTSDKLLAVNMLFMGNEFNAILDVAVGITPTFWYSSDIPSKFIATFEWINIFLQTDPYTGIAWTAAAYNGYNMGPFYSFTNTV